MVKVKDKWEENALLQIKSVERFWEKTYEKFKKDPPQKIKNGFFRLSHN